LNTATAQGLRFSWQAGALVHCPWDATTFAVADRLLLLRRSLLLARKKLVERESVGDYDIHFLCNQYWRDAKP